MQPSLETKPETGRDGRGARGGARSGEAQGGSRAGLQVRRRMSRTQRLRRWLLSGVVLLLLLLAGFIGYARHRARRALLDLPRLLGANIRSETNGFTYSQTVKGRTLFTIHAAKAIQRQDGKTTLRDVSVMLYGPAGSNRVDSIRGAEFEYDQPNGVVRAVGETTLDLASPVTGAGVGLGVGLGVGAQPKAQRVTVTAKGLIFLEKLGVAATDDQIRFVYGTTRGEARGADYDADTGMIHLREQVHAESLENGHRERVDAGAAEIDRNSRVAVLHRATVTDASDTMRAETLTVQLRQVGEARAGSVRQVRGEGGVEIVSKGDARLTAPLLEAELNMQNRPTSAVMRGGVRMHSAQGDGEAAEARVAFDGEAHAREVRLLRGVRLRTLEAAAGASRELSAEAVVGSLGRDGGRHTVLREAVATGGAKLTMVDSGGAGGRGASPATTVVSAATLHSFGDAVDGVWQLSRVEGSGGSSIDERDGSGVERTSTGESLVATLGAALGAAHGGRVAVGKAGGGGLATPGVKGGLGALETLVQQGHVRIVERRPAVAAVAGKPAKAAGESRGLAERAEYDGRTGVVLLTGSPEVSDAGMQVAAERISMMRETGDAEAVGAVKGSLVSAGSSEAAAAGAVKASIGGLSGGRSLSAGATVGDTRGAGALHFVAGRAVLRRKGNAAVLYGGERPVRLWNGSAQLDAPVVEIDRAAGKLYAHGLEGSAGAGVVRTILPAGGVGRDAGAPARKEGAAAGGRRKIFGGEGEDQAGVHGTVRIVSRDLEYVQGMSGQAGRADFHGGVRLDSSDGQIVSDSATAFLRPPRTRGATGQGSEPLMGDSVDHIVARGHVRLQQPGRTATGERVEYSTADQRFVMTGGAGAPPVVRDSVQGTVSGASLIFHAGDDSVEVVGGDGRPVRTETVGPGRKATGGTPLP